MGQVRCKVQISAKPGCAYGLQLMTAPPWFPIEVVVVMSVVFPTHLDPSAFWWPIWAPTWLGLSLQLAAA